MHNSDYISFYNKILAGRKSNKNLYNQKKILNDFFEFSKQKILDQESETISDQDIIYFTMELKITKDILTADVLALCIYVKGELKVLEDVKENLEDLFLTYLLETALKNLISAIRNPRNGFLKRDNSKYWSLSDLEIIKSYNTISNEVSRHFKPHLSNAKNNSNLIVYVEDISPIQNQTGTKLVLDYVYALSTSNKVDKIYLVVGNGNSLSIKSGVSGYTFRCNKFDIIERMKDDYGYNDNKVEICRLTDLYKEDSGFFEDTGTFISSLSPSVIIYFDYQPSIIISALSKLYPTVYVPMQVGLAPAVRPSIECVMAHDKRVNKLSSPKNYYQIIERQISYPLQDHSQESNASHRAGRHTLVTAAYDIDKRVVKDRLNVFLNQITNFLEEHNNWTYTVLGVSHESGLEMLKNANVYDRIDLSRIKFVKNDPDFVKVIKSSDIFIMPYHKGGGRAVRTAIEQGLIVLTLDNNDGNLYLHKDFIFSNELEMFRFVYGVANDVAKQTSCKTLLKNHYESLGNTELLSNFNLILDKAKTYFHAKKVLFLGDSHIQSFAHAQHFDDLQVFFKPVWGATASGIYNENSKTNSHKEFSLYLERINPDMAVLCLGEVDVGYLAWKKRNLNNEDVFSRLSKALFNIRKYVKDLSNKVERVTVISIPLPTVLNYVKKDTMKMDYISSREAVFASYSERIMATRLFNEQLGFVLKDLNGVKFVNLDSYMLDVAGVIKPELLQKNKHDHHYNPYGFCDIINKNLLMENILGD